MLTSLTRMVDLHAHPGGDLRLAWTDAQGDDARTLPRAEIVHLQKLADALGLVENRGRAGAIVEARTALSAALFALLDGPERVLTQAIDAAEVARYRLDLVVRARAEDRSTLSQHPATWMRWELLPLAVRRRPGRAALHRGAPARIPGSRPAPRPRARRTAHSFHGLLTARRAARA